MSVVDKILPGRKLDVLVAEYVFDMKPESPVYGWFGWHPRPCAEADEWQEAEMLKRYSTEISNAMYVVYQMKRKFSAGIFMGLDENGFTCVVCGKEDSAVAEDPTSLPTAICKAAVMYAEKVREKCGKV